MGFILGIAVTVWVLAISLITKQGQIQPESERDARLLFWILVLVVLISGGVFGWALGSLL